MATPEEPVSIPTEPPAASIERARGLGPAVFTHKQLLAAIRAELPDWSQSEGPSAVIRSLLEHRVANRFQLRSDAYRSVTRYRIGDVSPVQIAASLRPRGYLSHATAVFLHGLTDEAPATHYVNVEQSPKRPPSGVLTQQRLDQAFARQQRASNYVFTHDGLSYVVLSGKHTGDFGVVELETTGAGAVRATDLERTLVDIVVRPAYASGLYQVRKAFASAADRVSVERVVETLTALQHVYPYHQAIGFLLERSGVSAARLAPLQRLERRWDFYLTHGMKNPVLDPAWKIYHPRGF